MGIARNHRTRILNWMKIILQAIDHSVNQPDADPNRIGLIGFSLGAYLSLSLAVEEPWIKAVVDFFGGMPDHFAERLDHFPPVLILHGEKDAVVSVAEARKLASLLEARRLPSEMQLYSSAGHGFGPLDMMDAGRRTYLFLKKHLG